MVEGIIPTSLPLTSDTRLRAGLTEMPDLPFIDLLSLPIREKKKENHNVGTSPHLICIHLFLPYLLTQAKRNATKTGQCLHSSFFLDFLQRKEKRKPPISSIVSGSWSYPYPYRIARRQHPSLGKYLYMYKNPRFGSVTCLLAAWLLGCSAAGLLHVTYGYATFGACYMLPGWLVVVVVVVVMVMHYYCCYIRPESDQSSLYVHTRSDQFIPD